MYSFSWSPCVASKSPNEQLRRPVPPCQEAFIGVGKIRLCIFDDAAQRFEDFALRLHGALDLRVPGQAHVFEHRHPHAFETPSTEGLRKLAARLINRDRRVLVESGQDAQEEGAVGDIAGDRARNRQA